MALTAKLQLRQSQSLVMTPQLMQSIRLLQFNHAELLAFINREIEKNPLLELDEGSGGEASSEPSIADEKADGNESTDRQAAGEENTDSLSDWVSTDLETSSGEMETNLDTSLENVFDTETPQPRAMAGDPWKSGTAGGGEQTDPESWNSRPPDLAEFLKSQLALAFREPADLLAANQLIDCIDDDGYLRIALDELAETLGTGEKHLETVLAKVQEFDPPGIAARDLCECLTIQLRQKRRLDPAMEAFVNNLELVAKRDFATLMRLCGVGMDDITGMVEEIRALDPRPGSAFSGETAAPVVADVIVAAKPDGSWSIELNAETLPQVLVNRTYYAEVSKVCRDSAEKNFMTDCLQSANWLTKSLNQRAQTILKVATEIVKQQDMFLAFGIEHLKPLNLRTVADAIKMHESTVSRVTSNKYMMTPRGLFELKYFFTTAISATSGGDTHSAESVRHRIRQLIEAENAVSVLSDDTIVEQLRRSGIDIARRTVAKYRESMNIPSSVQRRREKRAFHETRAV